MFFTIVIALFISCSTDTESRMTEGNTKEFYVGTYTDGGSEGVYKYSLSYDGTLDSVGLMAVADNPSFLAISSNEKYLIACNEINSADGKGTVESYKITDDSLVFLSRSSSGGAHPCFVNINERGDVLTANYTGGNIGLLKLKEDGKLSSLLDNEQHYGEGGTVRQDKPHAHSVWFVPGTDEIISVDLGTNELWFSRIDSVSNKIIPLSIKKLVLNKGAGPRHLSFHPSNKIIYVLNELNSTVSLIIKNINGEYELGSSISTLPVEFDGENTCADIHISADGRFLYASNRGHNSIAIFEIDKVSGQLTFLQHEPTRGDGPRNFTFSPDDIFLVVANQNTNNIVSFKRNSKNGELQFVSEIAVLKPVCLLFE